MSKEQFVVDNSVVMAWCFEDENDSYVLGVLRSLEHAEAVAPAVWPLEIGNALLVAERNKRLARDDAEIFLALARKLPITVEQETPAHILTEIIALAREQRLSTYDASYLDIALRRGIPLATRDTALIKAAKKCRVPLYRPA